MQPNFWRAPTNNDEGCAAPFRFAFWKTAGLYAQCDGLTCTPGAHTVTVGAPSPITKPSRVTSNGLLALDGESFRLDKAFAFARE